MAIQCSKEYTIKVGCNFSSISNSWSPPAWNGNFDPSFVPSTKRVWINANNVGGHVGVFVVDFTQNPAVTERTIAISGSAFEVDRFFQDPTTKIVLGYIENNIDTVGFFDPNAGQISQVPVPGSPSAATGAFCSIPDAATPTTALFIPSNFAPGALSLFLIDVTNRLFSQQAVWRTNQQPNQSAIGYSQPLQRLFIGSGNYTDGSGNSMIGVFNRSTLALVNTFLFPANKPCAIEYVTSTGKLWASDGGGSGTYLRLLVINPVSGVIEHVVPIPSPATVGFGFRYDAHCDAIIATVCDGAGNNGALLVFDPHTFAVKHSIPVPLGRFRGVEIDTSTGDIFTNDWVVPNHTYQIKA